MNIVSTATSKMAGRLKIQNIAVTVSDKHKLQVSESKMLGSEFAPKEDKASQQFNTLHNEELRILYMSFCIVREFM
jgi:hypothetical protein